MRARRPGECPSSRLTGLVCYYLPETNLEHVTEKDKPTLAFATDGKLRLRCPGCGREVAPKATRPGLTSDTRLADLPVHYSGGRAPRKDRKPEDTRMVPDVSLEQIRTLAWVTYQSRKSRPVEPLPSGVVVSLATELLSWRIVARQLTTSVPGSAQWAEGMQAARLLLQEGK